MSSDGPFPVFLLEAWYTLDACVSEWVMPPRLAPTWAELHPGGLMLECPDAAELARTEEWLALAEMLVPVRPDDARGVRLLRTEIASSSSA